MPLSPVAGECNLRHVDIQMKILSLLPLLLIATSVLAQHPSADDQQLRDVATLWKEAYNRKDAKAVAHLYADDAYYVSQHVPGGFIHGRKAILANTERGISGGGHVDSIEILKSEIMGDLAYSVGTYHATNSGQKVTGRNILVLKKMSGRWLIVAHTSVVPDVP
jgi:uncharacterized protein (TIGR02246 family)